MACWGPPSWQFSVSFPLDKIGSGRSRKQRGNKYIFSLFDCLHCAYTERGRKRFGM